MVSALTRCLHGLTDFPLSTYWFVFKSFSCAYATREVKQKRSISCVCCHSCSFSLTGVPARFISWCNRTPVTEIRQKDSRMPSNYTQTLFPLIGNPSPVLLLLWYNRQKHTGSDDGLLCLCWALLDVLTLSITNLTPHAWTYPSQKVILKWATDDAEEHSASPQYAPTPLQHPNHTHFKQTCAGAEVRKYAQLLSILFWGV